MNMHDTPEQAAYRAKILTYGATQADSLALELEVQRLRVERDEANRLYLETDAELYEYERRYGSLEAVS